MPNSFRPWHRSGHRYSVESEKAGCRWLVVTTQQPVSQIISLRSREHWFSWICDESPTIPLSRRVLDMFSHFSTCVDKIVRLCLMFSFARRRRASLPAGEICNKVRVYEVSIGGTIQHGVQRVSHYSVQRLKLGFKTLRGWIPHFVLKPSFNLCTL